MEPTDYTTTPSSNKLSKLGLILLFILVVFVCVVGAGLWRVFVSEKVVTLEPKPGITISFGPSIDSESGSPIQKVLVKTDSLVKLRISKGVYTAVFSGASNYATQNQTTQINANTTIMAPELSYTLQALAAQLSQQASTINQALQAQTSLAGYSVQAGQIYLDGSWYAAKLEPINSTQSDTELVIMHKEAGQWKLVAGPSVTLYLGDYPGVPQAVLRDINNR